MTGLFILLILIGLGLYGLKEYYQIKLGSPPQQCSSEVVAGMMDLLDTYRDNGRLLNLGSGYGGVVLKLAQRFPDWQIDGVEQSPTPWLIANLRSIGKQNGNYRFHLSDTMTWRLQDYDIILVCQSKKQLYVWEPRFARHMTPGTLLIAVNTPLPRTRPNDAIVLNGGHRLFVYRKQAEQPAPVPVVPVDIIPDIIETQQDVFEEADDQLNLDLPSEQG